METKSFAGYLLITNMSPATWHAKLLSEPQVVGRQSDCDIVIPATYRDVSRKHAMIGSHQKGLWIRDLDSTGGTRLNGLPLQQNRQTPLVIGDRLSFAGLELFTVPVESAKAKEVISASAKTGPLAGTIRVLGRQSIESKADGRLHLLSPTELEVVRWISRGLTGHEEIAQKLFRSPNTVRTHLGNIFQKLSVHSKEELLILLQRRDPASIDLVDTQVSIDAVSFPT